MIKIYKYFVELYCNVIIYLASKKSGMLHKIRRALVTLRDGLAQESVETKDMVVIYGRYSRGKATKEEMRIANRQLRDVVSSLGLGVLLVLPFAPLTLPIIVKLGKRFGIDIIPSAFSKEDDEIN